ncbi:hypothetical protein KW799_02845, partial [Candidatus Parcubacteria bacterium]|nr:hypothetical protein [Candidatus Parcubacteria bacterium]
MEGRVHTRIFAAIIACFVAVSFVFIVPPKITEAGATSCVSAGLVSLGKSLFGKLTGSAVPIANSTIETSTAGTYIKDCVLTPIAITMARTMARNISNSIVNWINNDFKGRPGFVTDINGLIADSADETIGGFIYGSDLNFLCQPFSFQIRLALATRYSQSFQEQIRCSVSDITRNVGSFAKNNGGAGWNNWLEITTQSQNNVYGAYLMADSQLAQNLQGNLDKLNNMLNRNGGFLDFETCDRYETQTEVNARIKSGGAFQAQAGTNYISKTNPTGGFAGGPGSLNTSAKNTPSVTSNAFSKGFESATDTKPRCLKSSTKTPGSLVEAQATKVLGSWADQLNLANDIDQIVGALISHFADKMISGTQGFLGLSGSKGYARNSINYADASTLSGNLSNPDNAGLGDATDAANAGISNLFPVNSTDNV